MNLLNRLADEILGLGDGALYSIICILVVFSVLAIIILASYGSSKLVDYIQTKNAKEVTEQVPVSQTKEVKNTNITDDDMMAAVLVATIDYRNEIKKDVRLVSVKEVK
jgi:Na+-transporting methylmalonyl-CoA/oxaloacetate decarboxylase gamma subunit